MPLTHATTPVRTYRLRSFALFRFAFNWLSLILVLLGALNFTIFGMPPEIASVGRTFFAAGIPLLILIGLWQNWPMVWKIETSDDGLVFSTLFQKRFVSYSNLLDVVNKRWGNETIYVVHCRDQRNIRFPSGMNQQNELLSLLKEYTPEKFLTTERESCQGKVTLFRQAFFLAWSCCATVGGATLLISVLAKLLASDLHGAVAIVPAMLFLVLGIAIGTTTILRAKSARVIGRGLLVRTWLSEFEVAWTDIISVRRFPFGRTIVIASRTGWFLLGEELSRFDELSQLVQNSTKLISRDDKSDKRLPPIN